MSAYHIPIDKQRYWLIEKNEMNDDLSLASGGVLLNIEMIPLELNNQQDL